MILQIKNDEGAWVPVPAIVGPQGPKGEEGNSIRQSKNEFYSTLASMEEELKKEFLDWYVGENFPCNIGDLLFIPGTIVSEEGYREGDGVVIGKVSSINKETFFVTTKDHYLLNGPKGETGWTPDISVEAKPGDIAHVKNTGTKFYPNFVFTLPKGDKGDPGATGDKGDRGDKIWFINQRGVGFPPFSKTRAQWNSVISSAGIQRWENSFTPDGVRVGDIARFDGVVSDENNLRVEAFGTVYNIGPLSSYIETKDNFLIESGQTGQKGDTGPKGDQGIRGPQGPRGYSVVNNRNNLSMKLSELKAKLQEPTTIWNCDNFSEFSENAIMSLDVKILPESGSGDTYSVQVFGTVISKPSLGEIETKEHYLVGEKGDRGDQGIQGPEGPHGDTGLAATVSVKRTDTLPAGQNASVINEGTANDAQLVFSIPQGIQGIQGPVGPIGRSPKFIGANTRLREWTKDQWDNTFVIGYKDNWDAIENFSEYQVGDIMTLNVKVTEPATEPKINTVYLSVTAITGGPNKIIEAKIISKVAQGDVGADGASGAELGAADKLFEHDTREVDQTPQWYMNTYERGTVSEFKISSKIGLSGAYYCNLVTIIPWYDSTGTLPMQIAFRTDSLWIALRLANGTGSWGAWDNINARYANNAGNSAKADYSKEAYQAHYLNALSNDLNPYGNNYGSIGGCIMGGGTNRSRFRSYGPQGHTNIDTQLGGW